jgi:hypothetical protein
MAVKLSCSWSVIRNIWDHDDGILRVFQKQKLKEMIIQLVRR